MSLININKIAQGYYCAQSSDTLEAILSANYTLDMPFIEATVIDIQLLSYACNLIRCIFTYKGTALVSLSSGSQPPGESSSAAHIDEVIEFSFVSSSTMKLKSSNIKPSSVIHFAYNPIADDPAASVPDGFELHLIELADGYCVVELVNLSSVVPTTKLSPSLATPLNFSAVVINNEYGKLLE